MTRTPGTVSQSIAAAGLAVAMLFPLQSACGRERETVLHAFTESGDGGFPNANLLADGQGNLYGATEGGGNTGKCETGCGTVFRLAPGCGTVFRIRTSGRR